MTVETRLGERIKAQIKNRLGRMARFRHAVVDSIERMMEEAQERALIEHLEKVRISDLRAGLRGQHHHYYREVG